MPSSLRRLGEDGSSAVSGYDTVVRDLACRITAPRHAAQVRAVRMVNDNEFGPNNPLGDVWGLEERLFELGLRFGWLSCHFRLDFVFLALEGRKGGTR